MDPEKPISNKTRTGLVDELKQLIAASQTERILGKYFAQQLEKIQQAWHADIGPVSAEEEQEYQSLLQQALRLIQLNRQAKEADFSRNLDKKRQVVQKLEELAQQAQAQVLAGEELEYRLKQAEKAWNEIGPTYPKEWEILKQAYYTQADIIYEHLRDFRAQRRQYIEQSLNVKREIIALLEQLLSSGYPDNKNKWVDLTNTLLKVENHWKSIGFLDIAEDKKLNQRFKTIYLDFFKHKKEYYKKLIQGYKVNRDHKHEILEQIKAFVQSPIEDWSKAVRTFDGLYKEFVGVGSSSRKHDQLLWEEFKALADAFHDRRRQSAHQVQQEEVENLEKKKGLLEALRNYVFVGDLEADINQLEDYCKQFGALPSKDRLIELQFKTAIDECCSELDMPEAEVEKLKFNLKFTAVKVTEDLDHAIAKEKEAYQRELRKVEDKLVKLENNLTFFGKNARSMDELFAGSLQEMEQLKNRVQFLKDQIRLLEKTKRDIA